MVVYRSSNIATAVIISLLLVSMSFPIIPVTLGVQEAHGTFPSREVPQGFSVDICTWKDNKKGALSITYDDGLSSQVDNASVIMSILDLKGTFFITVDNVGIPYGATWSEWRSVADYGHEIASHTLSHPDLTSLEYHELYREVVGSKVSIEENLTNVRCQTFSYPMGLYNETVMDMVRDYYICARQDRHNISSQPAPVPGSPDDMYSIVPVEFGGGETSSELNALVDQTISSGDWLVEMIHAVGSGGYDPVDVSQFSNHMQYISTNTDEIWAAPFSNVSKYIQVRDSATLNVSHPESYLLDIVLDTPLRETYFDVPISINVSFPEDWIDIEVWRRGVPYIYNTIDAVNHRYTMLEIGANERIRVVQANLNPRVERFNPYPDIEVPFFPETGYSWYTYDFYLNYSSVMNRGPIARPMLWLDLNGDGDLDDIVNGYHEGRLNMSKLDHMDDDYTDGCIYHIDEIFPPGTNLNIRFSVLDMEGLEGVSSTGMGQWFKGPVLNDPPSLTSPPIITSGHHLLPTFTWSEAIDPDGDPLTYEFVIYHPPQGDIVNITTNTTSFEIKEELEFDEEYIAYLRCIDGRGGFSQTNELRFNLTNSPPGPITDIVIEYVDRLIPMFEMIAPDGLDLDGDPVDVSLIVYDMTTQPPKEVFFGGERDNTTLISNITLKDHTKYKVQVQFMDWYGWKSQPYSKEFYVNFPPLPINGITVEDLKGEENSLILAWNENEEADLFEYRIFRYESEMEPHAGLEPDMVYNVTSKTGFVDQNVTDGELYWYKVVGVDNDGALNVDGAYWVNATPIDDLAPDRIENITVVFQEQEGYYSERMLIQWNESSDVRFLGYRIYRNMEPLDDISGLIPIQYQNGTKTFNTHWDIDIEENMTYFYTVTAVDIYDNEFTTDLQWESGTFPGPRPEPPVDDDDDEDRDYFTFRNSVIWASIAAIFLLLVGIIYLSFILSQRRTHYYDEFEE